MIALVGDHNPDSKPHRAIPEALRLTGDTQLAWTWLHSSELLEPAKQLAEFHGVWCVPGSPYANMRGVLDAIRFARESGRPFLGTCGGFQHALLEYAEAIWGLDIDDSSPIITPLACMLDEVPAEIRIEPATRLSTIYGVDVAMEDYHCSYGLNPAHAWRLQQGPLRVAARDLAGAVRAIELEGHPFFVATLFQPERSALAGCSHPLIRAFAVACARAAG